MNTDDKEYQKQLEKKYQELKNFVSLRLKITSTLVGFCLAALIFLFPLSYSFDQISIITLYLIISFVWFSIIFVVFLLYDRKIFENQNKLIDLDNFYDLEIISESYQELKEATIDLDKLISIGALILVSLIIIIAHILLKMNILSILLFSVVIVFIIMIGFIGYFKIRQRIAKIYIDQLKKAKNHLLLTLILFSILSSLFSLVLYYNFSFIVFLSWFSIAIMSIISISWKYIMFHKKYKKMNLTVKSINKSLQDGSINSKAYYKLAKLYLNMNQYDKAIEAIDKCIVINKNFKNALEFKEIISKRRN